MKALITASDAIGAMAYWATRQHPYGRPAGLFEITDTMRAAATQNWPDGVSSLPMLWVEDWRDVERWLREALDNHPVLTNWNTPKSGHTQQVVFSSRYDAPRPEHDFIDIDALLRNVALMVWRGACAEKERDAAIMEAIGSPGDAP